MVKRFYIVFLGNFVGEGLDFGIEEYKEDEKKFVLVITRTRRIINENIKY